VLGRIYSRVNQEISIVAFDHPEGLGNISSQYSSSILRGRYTTRLTNPNSSGWVPGLIAVLREGFIEWLVLHSPVPATKWKYLYLKGRNFQP
jgi:hypothetical protein